MRQNLLATAEGTLDPKSSVGGDAALLAYSRGDQATPQISLLSLSFLTCDPYKVKKLGILAAIHFFCMLTLIKNMLFVLRFHSFSLLCLGGKFAYNIKTTGIIPMFSKRRSYAGHE